MTFKEWYKHNESKLYKYRIAVKYDLGKDVAKEIYDSLQPQWQPIETAPFGKQIIVCVNAKTSECLVCIKRDNGEINTTDGSWSNVGGEYWLPLPELPEE